MSDVQVNPATLEFVRQQSARARKRRAVASLLGLLCVAAVASAGYWGWNAHQKSSKAALAQELAKTPEKLFEAVRAGQLTRDEARDAGREAWEKREQEVMAGYFKTPAADRDKYLDGLIDEMQKRREEWLKNRPATRPTTRPDRDRGDRPTSRPAMTDSEREARGRARADNQSPMQRAQQGEFRAAMQARMAARGMQGGPGGGRGGFGGGGFGGGGGGRGGR